MKMLLFIITMLSCVKLSHADTDQVTIGGNLGLVAPNLQSIDPFDASIIPLPFPQNQSLFPTQGTLTFTYDSDTVGTNVGGQTLYTSTSANLTFGDYNIALPYVTFYLQTGFIRFYPGLFSLSNGTDITPYTYLYTTNQNSTYTPATLPTLTYSELNLSQSVMVITPDYTPSPEDYLFGSINSFSVTDLSAPEPSTLILLLCGLPLASVLVKRRVCT